MDQLELRIVKFSAMQQKDLAIAMDNQNGHLYGFIRVGSQSDLFILVSSWQRLSCNHEFMPERKFQIVPSPQVSVPVRAGSSTNIAARGT
ncbi:hypothetical protein J2X56_003000 [Herbaspirillum sp. 1173]|uniref:hypothetical protein n=1 Tax=Herbaspirillum sp. 1173 TaxID=2817734 RepID=UPI0011A9CBFD|nr:MULTISPECIES: hypothetical protein [unclassified Herbaspirillum]MDR6740976.1 hypothetical protein [Herbaspirillum sp. 1173]